MPDLNQRNNESELDFEVMPRIGEEKIEGVKVPGPPKTSPPRAHTRKLWKIFLISFVFLAVLAGLFVLGILGYKKYYKKNIPPLSNPPQINVPPPDTNKLDEDKDGLTLDQEIARATYPKKADTDRDGLADGDEVNIYRSDPLLSDTDDDGYDDGREVARGYSPIKAVDQKAEGTEIQEWTEGIARFGLHEPTKTTLKLKAIPEQSIETTTYSNQVFGYSLEIPSVLSFRESEGRNEVGIYISGTIPEDIDFKTDPISLVTAVKTGNQTLKEWIDSQYTSQDYGKSVEIEINTLKVIRLENVKSDNSCLQTKTFFPKDGTIIILTLTCEDMSGFVPLYDNIVGSFRYAE